MNRALKNMSIEGPVEKKKLVKGMANRRPKEIGKTQLGAKAKLVQWFTYLHLGPRRSLLSRLLWT